MMWWPDGKRPLAPSEHDDYYAGDADMIRHYIAAGRPYIVVAEPHPLEAVRQQPDLDDRLSPSFKTRTLTVRRAVGPAPFTGRPFRYLWRVAVDDEGRQVAGDEVEQWFDPAFENDFEYEIQVRRWALGEIGGRCTCPDDGNSLAPRRCELHRLLLDITNDLRRHRHGLTP